MTQHWNIDLMHFVSNHTLLFCAFVNELIFVVFSLEVSVTLKQSCLTKFVTFVFLLLHCRHIISFGYYTFATELINIFSLFAFILFLLYFIG
jgi:hypothetical protein